MLKLANHNGKPEIFYTLQGEGLTVGLPAVFIRLSLCNLQCVWCDTPYTWLFSDKKKHNTAKPFDMKKEILNVEDDEIINQVMAFPQCGTVIITGGEPLLQQQNLLSLCNRLILQGKRIEVETNGTILPKEIDQYVTQYNVSPKLENSGNLKARRDIREVMEFYRDSQKATFKFVVMTEDDLNEVYELLTKYNINNKKVFLMPEGVSEEAIRQKQIWIQQICKDKGFRFSTRLQILLYGSKQGT